MAKKLTDSKDGAAVDPALVPAPAIAVEPEWPDANPAAGDQQTFAEWTKCLKNLTDVGTLAQCCRDVLRQAQVYRVRPDVLADIVAPYAKEK